jgi:dimethylglycine dehydrogenase
VLTEMTVACNAPDDFTLITAAVAQWHDREWLEDASARGPHAARPHARDVHADRHRPRLPLAVRAISDGDLTLPWLSHHACTVAGRPATLARVSFAGELGWEVHAPSTPSPTIYEAILSEGAKPFGMWALNSLRLEKAYRTWKGDLSTDYTLLEGGLDRFIRFDKPQDFPGKAALLSEWQRGSKKRFAVLTWTPAMPTRHPCRRSGTTDRSSAR